MEREIKFRAWERKTLKMWFFNLISIFGGGRIGPYNDIDLSDCEIQQYTGLKDKNGKEIYEGDIVHVGKDGQVWSVEYALFGEPRFGVFNQVNSCRDIELNGQEDDITGFYAVDEFIPLQVIGNIYENPELIK